MKGLCIGRMVRYVVDGRTQAAVVTRVLDDDTGEVVLNVFDDGGSDIETLRAVIFNSTVAPAAKVTIAIARYNATGLEGTWHWPQPS